jgi:hypothetical protein
MSEVPRGGATILLNSIVVARTAVAPIPHTMSVLWSNYVPFLSQVTNSRPSAYQNQGPRAGTLLHAVAVVMAVSEIHARGFVSNRLISVLVLNGFSPGPEHEVPSVRAVPGAE